MKDIREFIENDFKNWEEYIENQCEYVIDRFPRSHWCSSQSRMIELSTWDWRDLVYKDELPWPEEIPPEDFIEVIEKREYESGEIENITHLIHKDIKDSNCYREYVSILSNPFHYSTNPRVWWWDWSHTTDIRKEGKGYNICYSVPNLQYLGKMIGIFKKKGIKYKYKIYNDDIDGEIKFDIQLITNIGKRSYVKFRESLVEFKKEGIPIRYGYEDIRWICGYSSNVII